MSNITDNDESLNLSEDETIGLLVELHHRLDAIRALLDTDMEKGRADLDKLIDEDLPPCSPEEFARHVAEERTA